ncbi:MAG: hypothetical protein M3320_04710 [Actinomycetota bacterium]|nr:hypothetical protein [Actinomycetota bacterium]MDQ5807957.1 hypothetical protein [Actinomycetota bacterium]
MHADQSERTEASGRSARHSYVAPSPVNDHDGFVPAPGDAGLEVIVGALGIPSVKASAATKWVSSTTSQMCQVPSCELVSPAHGAKSCRDSWFHWSPPFAVFGR